MTNSSVPVAGVPTLSLSAFANGDAEARALFSADLFEGLRRYGFIILKDHGIDPALLQRAYRCATDFFDQPVVDKRRYAAPDGQRGYTALGVEHAKDSAAPDLKEFWHVGREEGGEALYAPNVWPEGGDGFDADAFREAFLALYRGLETAGDVMLAALEAPLNLPGGFFAKMTDGGDSILRLLHYPPTPTDADPRAIRAAAHEDINLITLLVSASASGLELLDRDGAWLAVETTPDAVIVDAGDMLARITNGKIPATTHRVVNPEGPNVSRYSMPFFMHPHPDAMLEVIDSCEGPGAQPPIAAGEFLRQRLREIGLAG